MSDYIKRMDAINAVYKAFAIIIDSGNFTDMQSCEQVNRFLNSVPSADVVDVCRCKDCARASNWQTLGICDVWKKRVRADFYCGFGVRKEKR